MNESEVVLVKRAQEGDMGAFTELVTLHRKKIYDLAYQMSHNHEDAEDIAQEVFIKLWRIIHKFKGKSSFFTWLYRVAVNVCKNYFRRKSSSHTVFQEAIIDKQLAAKNNPVRELISKETRQAIARAIEKLPFKHRMVVILHDIQGLSHKQISEIMGCSCGTVRSRLFYASEKLKGELAEFL